MAFQQVPRVPVCCLAPADICTGCSVSAAYVSTAGKLISALDDSLDAMSKGDSERQVRLAMWLKRGVVVRVAEQGPMPRR